MGYTTLATVVRVDRELNETIQKWPGAQYTGTGTMWVKTL